MLLGPATKCGRSSNFKIKSACRKILEWNDHTSTVNPASVLTSPSQLDVVVDAFGIGTLEPFEEAEAAYREVG